MPTPLIRLLTSADGPQYQQLRLRSLRENPVAFLSIASGEEKLHESAFARHLDWAYHPPHFGYFGLFVPETDNPQRLVGYVQVGKTFLEKQDHIAQINNLYFLPEYRGQGLAEQLFAFLFDLLQKDEYIERIFLTCSAKNKPALRFYQKIGFRRYGVKAKSIKWQGEYDDEIEMVKVL